MGGPKQRRLDDDQTVVSWRKVFIATDDRAKLRPLLRTNCPLDPRCCFKPPPNQRRDKKRTSKQTPKHSQLAAPLLAATTAGRYFVFRRYLLAH